jgi:hypothetical protein
VSNKSRDRGAVGSVVIAVLSLVLGGGAAVAAVAAVVSSTAPNDSRAVQTGPKEPVDPAKVITYGG